MNQQGVIHNDMKEDNILIKDKDGSKKSIPTPTIIDWGISGISTHHHPIPEIIMNRYISISNPFSSILFTIDFNKKYSEFLKIHDTQDPLFQEQLNEFCILQYLNFKEHGHYSHIQNFFINVFELFPDFIISLPLSLKMKQNYTPEDFYHVLVSNYISKILIEFTEVDQRDGVARFQYVKYFTKVYIFNCDIWGIMFCYSIFFSFKDKYKYDKHIGIESIKYSTFLRNLLSIYMNQIMIDGHEKINVSDLIKSITIMNTIK
jgi:serine/threonine protein kinase